MAPPFSMDLAVKIMLLLNTYSGYFGQHFIIVDMLWPHVLHRFQNATSCTLLILNYVVRYAIVLLAFGLAYAIPDLENIVPFVGMTCGISLALVFPPVLHIIVFGKTWKQGSCLSLIYNVAHNIFYVVFGVVLAVVGIYSSILDMQKQ
ncbi:hypothetical protein OESDEN_16752 [Oesophagostomum dentatum]|uniref:Amino acid transporter transmembrane domain-containing protein n=1 Tax=Oesophagostomum dentatum TaxID=61180 RepID=A0A0B1SE07_OESDE|nr:hypothetical protein OESDEN_16752 [Oesophagostomum dentatum]